MLHAAGSEPHNPGHELGNALDHHSVYTGRPRPAVRADLVCTVCLCDRLCAADSLNHHQWQQAVAGGW
jgi:hypothetical protein